MVPADGPVQGDPLVRGSSRMESIAGLSRRAVATAEGMAPVLDFHFRSRYGGRRGDPRSAISLSAIRTSAAAGLVAAIRERAVPQDKDWFAYKTSEEAPQALVAERARAASSACPSSRRTSP